MSNFKTVFSFMAGALAGITVGLLTAPRSGKKTRKVLAKEIEHGKEIAEQTLDKNIAELKKEYSKNIDKYAEQGKTYIDQVKDMVHTKN